MEVKKLSILNINTIEEPLKRAATLIRNCDTILWVGSGLSIYTGYPSGAELSKRIMEAAESEKDKAILQAYENSLMDLSSEFSQLYSREKLIEVLKLIFDKVPCTEPTIHYLISKIPQLNTIITTNYDHLFEIAFNNEITVCTGTSFNKTVRGMVDLYKIHGDTSEPDSIIITSKDYAKFYEKLDTILWNKIKGLLAEKSIIFVGYSLEDKNIQDVFEKIISQIESSDKEFFIVTPNLYEHKLKYLNTICKTTHIPLTGEEFINYIEAEIRKNIVLDAVAKKISVDEAYKICREHGITPTIVNEPYGTTTKPIVEKITLSPETFFDHVFMPFSRGANFKSNPETYEDMWKFINDCDCRELIIPAEDAIIFQNMNGIHIPENPIIKGQFPDVVKIEKKEMVEKLNLVLGEDNSHGCIVCIRGFWGNVRNRMTIELTCMNICIERDEVKTNFNFSFRYPHSTHDAIADLARLQLWCNGTEMVFNRSSQQLAFILNGLTAGVEINELVQFLDDKVSLYQNIKSIEQDISEPIIIDKELITDDISNIIRAAASLSPQTVNYSGTFSVDVGKITAEQFMNYVDNPHFLRVSFEYPEVLSEDCLDLFGKHLILGKRKMTILQPYISNFTETEEAIKRGQNVILNIASETKKAILEFVQVNISDIV